MNIANFPKHRLLAFVAAIVVMWDSNLARGQAPVPGDPNSIFAFDAREVAMLPRYCMYTQRFRETVPGGNNPDAIRTWTETLGETFIHLHHYCYGLMDFNRGTLLARDAQARRFYLGDAIGQYDYVLQVAPPNFILLPEILTKKGETLVKLGRAPLAIEQFERAIQLKPDYWPPYAHLSDYYRETGDLAKARELLEQGLTASPDAKGLQRRLAELETGSPKRKGSSTASGKR